MMLLYLVTDPKITEDYPGQLINWGYSSSEVAFVYPTTLQGSEDKIVAVVQFTGVEGEITVYAYSSDMEYMESVTIRAEYADEALSMAEGTPDYLLAGKYTNLKVYSSLQGSNLASNAVTWALADAADSDYVTLTAAGKLTAKTVTQRQEVTVIGTYNPTGVTVSHTVTIYPLATKVDIQRDGEIVTGQTLVVDVHGYSQDEAPGPQLTAALTPADAWPAEEPRATWTTSSAAIAKVDEAGRVSAQWNAATNSYKTGTAKITAKAKDGTGKYASVTVKFIYLDEATKLTAKAEVPTIGLQAGYSTTMKVFV